MATGTIIFPIAGAKRTTDVAPALAWENYRAQLLFDADTQEYCYYTFRMPANYSSTLVAKLQFKMASATSGNVVLAVDVMAVTPDDAVDLGTDSYDTTNTDTVAVPGTAGYMKELSLSLVNNDSVAAGDYVGIRLTRDADNAADTATGDLELVGFSLEYTTAV